MRKLRFQGMQTYVTHLLRSIWSQALDQEMEKWKSRQALLSKRSEMKGEKDSKQIHTEQQGWLF